MVYFGDKPFQLPPRIVPPWAFQCSHPQETGVIPLTLISNPLLCSSVVDAFVAPALIGPRRSQARHITFLKLPRTSVTEMRMSPLGFDGETIGLHPRSALYSQSDPSCFDAEIVLDRRCVTRWPGQPMIYHKAVYSAAKRSNFPNTPPSPPFPLPLTEPLRRHATRQSLV